jgi:hypothetical protein
MWFEADDKLGNKAKSLHQKYYDITDFRVSTAGEDSVRDDKIYLEDIA